MTMRSQEVSGTCVAATAPREKIILISYFPRKLGKRGMYRGSEWSLAIVIVHAAWARYSRHQLSWRWRLGYLNGQILQRLQTAQALMEALTNPGGTAGGAASQPSSRSHLPAGSLQSSFH